MARKPTRSDCGVTADGVGPQRRCAVCRKPLDRDDSVRFVLGPDGVAAIDWRRKLPGRGASVCWSREGLAAVGRGGVLDRAFKTRVKLPAEPEWPLGAARAYVRAREKELIGLAARAGQLKAGGNVVLRVVRKGWATAIVLASDAGETVAADWERKCRGYELPMLRSSLGSEDIGAALGRPAPRSVLGLHSGPLVTALQTELKRGSAVI
jgi:predicted RNA-binding protein YlxR (DUF448 family)/ribosomal protein L30E